MELTIALHRVFDAPLDSIVFDVGHQCYTHKLLTGRVEAFAGLRQVAGLSGFPNRRESPYDCFGTGHASTSISAALGLLIGDRLQGGAHRSIAVIGDGALTGGLAYEALSHAGHLGLPLIVVLNDNKMSISPNVGGLSHYLSRLSMKRRYQTFRKAFDSALQKVPFVGELLFNVVVRLKRAVKAVFYTDNFFVDLGFEYVGPIDGHSIDQLEKVFRDVRALERPVVVHVLTKKGKGYRFAEEDPSRYHGVGSFSRNEGLNPAQQSGAPTFTDAFGQALLESGRHDRRVVGISAAMEKGTGLSAFHVNYPDRFFDVGIAEEHAVTFAAGLAVQGLRPVLALYSTFAQRAVDQIIHDVALQKLPVTFAVDRAGFVSDDGVTHQGLFDCSLFRPIPGMTIFAPASAVELAAMLHYALSCDSGPVMIRYPKALCPPEIPEFSMKVEPGRGLFIRREGNPVCIAFTGSLYPQVCDAAKLYGPVDLYNIRFIQPVDEAFLAEIMNNYQLLLFVEEGIKAGGFGEYASEIAHRFKCRAQICVLGVDGTVPALGKREELLRINALDGAGIAERIRSWNK
ncbi:1-deoxy-D-xylulose-5-phosphate synthase [Spirochaetia bacterium]|nr:1-deoxy-D-xylulose-5-phosphate synthase [Spirochaetia bacterium]